MRYEPYSYEIAAIPTMDDAALLEFFLTRVYETEEIWGLNAGGGGWMTYKRNGEETLPVFAYKFFAEEGCVNEREAMVPVSESIEYFMETSLPDLIQDNVVLEIMPGKARRGSLVTAGQLYEILDNMIENGTYSL